MGSTSRLSKWRSLYYLVRLSIPVFERLAVYAVKLKTPSPTDQPQTGRSKVMIRLQYRVVTSAAYPSESDSL